MRRSTAATEGQPPVEEPDWVLAGGAIPAAPLGEAEELVGWAGPEDALDPPAPPLLVGAAVEFVLVDVVAAGSELEALVAGVTELAVVPAELLAGPADVPVVVAGVPVDAGEALVVAPAALVVPPGGVGNIAAAAAA